MNNICSITVTYNRRELLRKNICLLLKQTVQLSKIYIIDNCSTDGTYEYIKDLIDNNAKIKYIRLNENLGGSGGFYEGIKHACGEKHNFLWGMDDDAFPETNALEELITAYKEIDKECCLWSNCHKEMFDNNIKKVSYWMFVGFFMPISIVEKVGLPRKDFFIYHDDTEYSYRIIKKGFDIYKIKKSIIDHKDMSNRDVYNKNILGLNIQLAKMDDWRIYYLIRNGILRYKCNDVNKYKHIFIEEPKRLIKICLINRSQFKIGFKGYLDGIRGISGKTVKP